jgi:DNA-binding transcriptional LysR family regulator
VILGTQQLRSFLVVAELGNYTHAAQRLFLSQPGVYQHVRQLEATLNTRLVEQHGKRVVLTQHGREVLEYARRREEEEADLLQRLTDDESLSSGSVTIAAGTTAAEFILPRIAVAFQERYPGIVVRIAVLGKPSEVDESVGNREYDLGFHSEPRDVDGVSKAPFLMDELVGIAPPGHRFAEARRPVPPRSVAAERYLAFSDASGSPFAGAVISRMVQQWFESSDAMPETQIHLGSLQGIKTAVRQGAGVGIVSRFAVRDDDPSLKVFRLARPPLRPFVIVTRSGGWESNVIRTFREFAVSCSWIDSDAERAAVQCSAEDAVRGGVLV